MSKRKNISVEDLKAEVNRRLAIPSLLPEQRAVLASLLESVLHDTGNYAGYQDVYWIREGGYEAWKASGLEDTIENYQTKKTFFYSADGSTVDNYRRVYY